MLDKFYQYLEIEKRYSKHTLVAYTKDVEDFLLFLGQIEVALTSVSKRELRSYLVEMVDQQLENTSISRKVSALRTLFKWAVAHQYMDTNPMIGVLIPKLKKRNPVFLKETEMKEMHASLFREDFEGYRDYLMLELFYQTGIRLSELIELKQASFSPDSIKVLGKRNKERIIPISNQLYQLYQKYCGYKSVSVERESPYVFVLNSGNKLYEKFVYRKINFYLGLITKIEKKSPHVLRHTFATHLLNNGSGLEVLKELLGHSNLAATQVYTHNSFSQLTHIYSQAHPRGHKIKKS